MKNILLISILLFALLVTGKAQESNDVQVYLDIQKLVDLKVDYEKYTLFKRQQKKDSLFILYRTQTCKIKKSPKIYLSYIKQQIKNNEIELTKESLPYRYINGSSSSPVKGRDIIKKIDLYRVIKYSLFKKGDSLLPENFLEIPVVDKRNYFTKYKPKPGERKEALNYLKQNLSLNEIELEIIYDKNNTKTIVEMKDWLQKYGISNDEKKFIKWAINYLKERPGEYLARLNSIYNLIKLQDYKPKDRQPDNF